MNTQEFSCLGNLKSINSSPSNIHYQPSGGKFIGPDYFFLLQYVFYIGKYEVKELLKEVLI